MCATARPSREMTTLAPSCLKRPSIVCLRGVEVGSVGSTSTIHPKRCGSFGSSSRLKRGSTLLQPRPAPPVMPYRAYPASRGRVPSKYWLKFSSPDSTVPHGVIPPEQLFRVPRARRPVGSAVVLSRASPAAGPSMRKGVSMWIRRFWGARRRFLTWRHDPRTSPRFSVTTDMPWFSIESRLTCSAV